MTQETWMVLMWEAQRVFKAQNIGKTASRQTIAEIYRSDCDFLSFSIKHNYILSSILYCCGSMSLDDFRQVTFAWTRISRSICRSYDIISCPVHGVEIGPGAWSRSWRDSILSRDALYLKRWLSEVIFNPHPVSTRIQHPEMSDSS
jgi:hypothetical protein